MFESFKDYDVCMGGEKGGLVFRCKSDSSKGHYDCLEDMCNSIVNEILEKRQEENYGDVPVVLENLVYGSIGILFNALAGDVETVQKILGKLTGSVSGLKNEKVTSSEKPS